MKTLRFIRKNKLLVLVVLAYGLVLLLAPDKALQSVKNSTYYLLEMLQVMPIVFLLTAVIEALVAKETIMRGFGPKSGFKGNLLALLLGSVSAGPIYAAFPISKSLLGKGASVTNIMIILSPWAVIKVPMLANEAKFLGPRFMAVRWILTVIAIFIMAYASGMIIKDQDLPKEEAEKKELVKIRAEYCIGCELCVRQLPAVFAMEGAKAQVQKMPQDQEELKVATELARRCPTGAIIIRQTDMATNKNKVDQPASG